MPHVVPVVNVKNLKMTAQEFQYLKNLIKDKAGIQISESRQNLLQTRLLRRLRQKQLASWKEYIDLLESNDQQEMQYFINAMTTNKTEFFRERAHFDYIEREILAKKEMQTITVWIAACSYGQEAYSLAMMFEKIIKKKGFFKYRILATDIDTNVLHSAANGVYDRSLVMKTVSTEDLTRFFLQGRGRNENLLKVSNDLKENIKFRYHNLCALEQKVPMKFDYIFVRNVLIYFDHVTVENVIKKLASHMKAEGTLFTGHCESLADIECGLKSIEPSVYRFKSQSAIPLIRKENSEEKKIKHLKTHDSSLSPKRKMIRVMVVDDSKVIQKLMESTIRNDSDLDFYGVANDPVEAEKVISERGFEPDVMILDINMPRMNGIDYLEKHLSKRKIAVVMMTSLSNEDGDLSLKSMDLGAIDFIEKPQSDGLSFFRSILKDKLIAASQARKSKFQFSKRGVYSISEQFDSEQIIAIGSSTGGTVALSRILPEMPREIPPILIVQHIPAHFSRLLANRLDQLSQIHVKEAIDGEKIEPGVAYVAPGDKHLSIIRKGNGLVTKVEAGLPVNKHQPAVDVLFDSIAKFAASKAIGLLLTGMGKDGAQGLLRMKEAGAYTIAEAEESCVVFGMPKEAIRLGAVNEVIHLSECTRHICAHLSKKKKAS